MNKQMVGRVQHKHDTEANWLKATNFIPLDGELIIYDADENNPAPRFKVGDGETVVSALPFSKAEADVDQDSLSFAYFEEDGTEYLPDALPIDADSLGGYPASSYSTTEQLDAQYVKASIEDVVMSDNGEVKPQSPLMLGENGILPLTSYDQIIMPDGTRWNGMSGGAYKAGTGIAISDDGVISLSLTDGDEVSY